MGDINVHLINLHNGRIRECVTKNDDGSYSIFIEASLSRNEQIKAYRHALTHIDRNDIESELSADLVEFEAHKEGDDNYDD